MLKVIEVLDLWGLSGANDDEWLWKLLINYGVVKLIGESGGLWRFNGGVKFVRGMFCWRRRGYASILLFLFIFWFSFVDFWSMSGGICVSTV
jgi:hypothetical protein